MCEGEETVSATTTTRSHEASDNVSGDGDVNCTIKSRSITRRRKFLTKSAGRSKSSDSRIIHKEDSGKEMRDWRTAIRRPINYSVSNDVVRLQTTFVTVVMVMGTLVLLMFYLLLPSKVNMAYPPVHEDHLHAIRQPCPVNGITSSTIAYNATYPLSRPEVLESGAIRYRIALIADLDHESKSMPPPANSSSSSSSSSASSYWHSFLLKGHLTYDSVAETVSIEWDESGRHLLKSPLSSAGRGMELSELVVFNGKLYSCDDRTGIVFQIPNLDGDKREEVTPVPWIILNDGSGASAKGFKCEWMTVKDQMLHVGGFGKEWTSTTGELLNFDPQWIKVISVTGVVTHVNWRMQFVSLMKAAGIQYPGYMIHESAAWSGVHKRWFFLPRRASHEMYNEVQDERRGTNMLISTDESFTDVTIKKVGQVIPTLGYSSFKFIPGTEDQLIVAIKSQEDAGSVATFISVFRTDGHILLSDQRVTSESVKYEGIEFI